MRKQYSMQRVGIIRILQKTNMHPSADTVYNQIRESIPNISLGTVYRNLNDMVESGEIRKVTTPSATDRFDGNTSRHYHLVCQKCHRISDMHEYSTSLDEDIANRYSCQVLGHEIYFNVVCADCLPTEKN